MNIGILNTEIKSWKYALSIPVVFLLGSIATYAIYENDRLWFLTAVNTTASCQLKCDTKKCYGLILWTINGTTYRDTIQNCKHSVIDFYYNPLNPQDYRLWNINSFTLLVVSISLSFIAAVIFAAFIIRFCYVVYKTKTHKYPIDPI